MNRTRIQGLTREQFLAQAGLVWDSAFGKASSSKAVLELSIVAKNLSKGSPAYDFEKQKPEPMLPMNVPEMLEQSAATYRERNEIYGDNYKNFGKWTSQLFPNGLTVKTVDDWNRLGVLVQKMSKLSRYAETYESGGHDDSLLDDAVYTTMLRELDKEALDESDIV